MKVLFLIADLSRGGAERQLSYIAAGMNHKFQNEVLVVTYFAKENVVNNENYSYLIDNGVRVIAISNGKSILMSIINYIRIIKAEKPDIMYSFMPFSNLLGCLAKMFFPRLKLVWGVRVAGLELNKYKLLLRVKFWLEKKFARVPNLIISNSYYAKDCLIKNQYPKDRITVVCNGVDTTKNSKYLDGRLSMFSQLPVNSNSIIIGAVGRIDYQKDYDVLLRCAKLVANKNNDVIFVVVGRVVRDDYFQGLLKLKQDLSLNERFFFIPEMSNVTELYNCIDIFVSSSYAEGFSNVIAEAMACELPCVVTDAGDNKILLGDSTYVVPIRDERYLANKLISLAACSNEQRKELGGKLRERVSSVFSIKSLIDNTVHALNSM